MGIIRRIADLQLGSIGTTKVLQITSSETVWTIHSGNRAAEVMNFGVVNLFYGQSNLLASSGLIIASSNGAKFWDSVVDNFTLYFRISSGGYSNQVIVHEYQGNN